MVLATGKEGNIPYNGEPFFPKKISNFERPKPLQPEHTIKVLHQYYDSTRIIE